MIKPSTVIGKDEAAIWTLINDEWPALDLTQRHLWELIKVMPEKWISKPYKYRPAECWVVAVIGTHVIWYDETWFGEQFDSMDSGFTCSRYTIHGQIEDNFCAVGSLADAVQTIQNRINRM